MSNANIKIVIGCDPASGASSNTGFSAILVDTKEIICLEEIAPNDRFDTVDERIYTIAQKYANMLELFAACSSEEVLVCFEHFIMKGRGGEVLNRVIGAFLGHTRFSTHHIATTAVKKYISGTGLGDKEDVVKGLLRYYEGNKDALDLIEGVRDNDDITDSLAIAIAGYDDYLKNSKIKPKKRTTNGKSKTKAKKTRARKVFKNRVPKTC